MCSYPTPPHPAIFEASITAPLTVLGLETSCDETAAAVARLWPGDRVEVLSSVVLSQTADPGFPAGRLKGRS